MRRQARRRPTILAVAGLCAVVLASGVAAAAFHDPERTTGEHAAGAFLTAWERSRQGTFVVRSRFERRTPAGGRLVAEVRLAQRPPDRLLVQFGSVEGRRDGAVVRCATEPGGQFACGEGDVAVPYGEEVQAEVDRLASYVQGEQPLYRVRADDEGCFDLELARALPAPPYGRQARFCFDEATGAPVLAEVRQAEGVTVTEAVEVRGEVTDGDLEVPSEAPEPEVTPAG